MKSLQPISHIGSISVSGFGGNTVYNISKIQLLNVLSLIIMLAYNIHKLVLTFFSTANMKLRSDMAFCFINLLDLAAKFNQIGINIENFIGLDESRSSAFEAKIHESIELYKSFSSAKIESSS
jgi:hypothetical protein